MCFLAGLLVFADALEDFGAEVTGKRVELGDRGFQVSGRRSFAAVGAEDVVKERVRVARK
jgi:hypothetical protein